jgi:hypothetical protein
MGTIEVRADKNGSSSYRARVRLSGLPALTRTFLYRDDAEKWIKQQENDLSQSKALAQKVSLTQRIPMPPQCACYVLYDRGKCIYIGSSNGNVLGRIANHARRMQFDAFSYVPCEPHQLLAQEYRLIQELQPPQNKLGRCDSVPGRFKHKTTEDAG